jgi:hypothetical protein
MSGCGCGSQHEAWALRRRLIGEIERLGGFSWPNLTHADPVVTAAARAGLRRAARAVGQRENTEQEGNDDRA